MRIPRLAVASARGPTQTKSADPDLPGSLKAALIPLKTETGHGYWLGLNNVYAMVVYQLAEELKV